MKFKKNITLILCAALFMGILVGCGEKKQDETQDGTVQTETQAQKTAINPALYDAFGKDFMDGESETIEKLVKGLETCYIQYESQKDLDAFVNDVYNAMEPYNDYLGEFSDELSNMVHNETDQAKKEALALLQMESINHTFPAMTWLSYKTNTDLGFEPMHTEDETEEALIQYINAISNFFYCYPIAE